MKARTRSDNWRIFYKSSVGVCDDNVIWLADHIMVFYILMVVTHPCLAHLPGPRVTFVILAHHACCLLNWSNWMIYYVLVVKNKVFTFFCRFFIRLRKIFMHHKSYLSNHAYWSQNNSLLYNQYKAKVKISNRECFDWTRRTRIIWEM